MKKKLISLVEAIKVINEAFDNDPAKSGRDVIKMQTLYNAMNTGKLHKHGTRHFRQVEVHELLSVFGPKKQTG